MGLSKFLIFRFSPSLLVATSQAYICSHIVMVCVISYLADEVFLHFSLDRPQTLFILILREGRRRCIDLGKFG